MSRGEPDNDRVSGDRPLFSRTANGAALYFFLGAVDYETNVLPVSDGIPLVAGGQS
jgi:hypothetical protein